MAPPNNILDPIDITQSQPGIMADSQITLSFDEELSVAYNNVFTSEILIQTPMTVSPHICEETPKENVMSPN